MTYQAGHGMTIDPYSCPGFAGFSTTVTWPSRFHTVQSTAADGFGARPWRSSDVGRICGHVTSNFVPRESR